MIEAVVFDVGETLVDETRAWGRWADHLGVPRLTMFAVLGAIIARGGSHREVFELFRPGLDVDAEARRLHVAGRSDWVSLDDLYPDAVPCLQALAGAGYRLAIAANQPAPTAATLRQLPIEFELVATSAAWGIAKPDPAFFRRICDELDLEPSRIAYVGDRLDNDLAPARALGMATVFVRRGPWGWIQAGRADPPTASVAIGGLAELLPALRGMVDRAAVEAPDPG